MCVKANAPPEPVLPVHCQKVIHQGIFVIQIKSMNKAYRHIVIINIRQSTHIKVWPTVFLSKKTYTLL